MIRVRHTHLHLGVQNSTVVLYGWLYCQPSLLNGLLRLQPVLKIADTTVVLGNIRVIRQLLFVYRLPLDRVGGHLRVETRIADIVTIAYRDDSVSTELTGRYVSYVNRLGLAASENFDVN